MAFGVWESMKGKHYPYRWTILQRYDAYCA